MLQRSTFGILPDGQAVDVIPLRNATGLEMRVITYGCIIVSLTTPDRDARAENIVLGFDRLGRYVAASSYAGAVVGRYANRIAHARFSLDGRPYDVSANEPPHHLHGGFSGFDKRLWDAEAAGHGSSVVFRRRSPDGEEGFPGNLDVQVTYTLTDRHALRVDYEAETDAPTHVNLTQHSYFNLRGVSAGPAGDVREHRLTIDADMYLPITGARIPTGEIAPVSGTPFDFREPTDIGARHGGQYDHNFVLNRVGAGVTPAARVVEPVTGRAMEVRTTEPGLQLYAGGDHQGFCLETQHYPDSPNQKTFPSTILQAGKVYSSKTIWTFSAK